MLRYPKSTEELWRILKANEEKFLKIFNFHLGSHWDVMMGLDWIKLARTFRVDPDQVVQHVLRNYGEDAVAFLGTLSYPAQDVVAEAPKASKPNHINVVCKKSELYNKEQYREQEVISFHGDLAINEAQTLEMLRQGIKGFAVTHIASGLSLHVCDTIEQAQEIVELLNQTDIDFSQVDIRKHKNEILAVIRSVLEEVLV